MSQVTHRILYTTIMNIKHWKFEFDHIYFWNFLEKSSMDCIRYFDDDLIQDKNYFSVSKRNRKVKVKDGSSKLVTFRECHTLMMRRIHWSAEDFKERDLIRTE